MKFVEQSEKISDDKFVVLICDIDDLIPNLMEGFKGYDYKLDKPVKLTKEQAEKMARKLLDSERFRYKFTDGMMEDFWLVMRSLIDNKEDYLE